MRARYGAEGVFPRVFAKTRPEVWPCLGLVDDAPLRRALAPAPHPRPAHPSTPPPLVPRPSSHLTPHRLVLLHGRSMSSPGCGRRRRRRARTRAPPPPPRSARIDPPRPPGVEGKSGPAESCAGHMVLRASGDGDVDWMDTRVPPKDLATAAAY
jgi:hypothetical protein